MTAWNWPGKMRGRLLSPSTGWTGTIARLLFGLIFAIDAYLKWLPGYRKTYLSQLKSAAAGQPSWLHGWFHFWVSLQSSSPTLFAVLSGVAETALALVLLLGLARRAGYILGAAYMLLVWAVGEGFGGPYMAGSTDVGTGIVYALLFTTLLVFARLPAENASASIASWCRAGHGGESSQSRTPLTACREHRASNRSQSTSTRPQTQGPSLLKHRKLRS